MPRPIWYILILFALLIVIVFACIHLFFHSRSLSFLFQINFYFAWANIGRVFVLTTLVTFYEMINFITSIWDVVVKVTIDQLEASQKGVSYRFPWNKHVSTLTVPKIVIKLKQTRNEEITFVAQYLFLAETNNNNFSISNSIALFWVNK